MYDMLAFSDNNAGIYAEPSGDKNSPTTGPQGKGILHHLMRNPQKID